MSPSPKRGPGRPNGYFLSSTGVEVPSVTTILKRFKESEGLIRWAYNRGAKGEELYGSAADVGSIVHAMAEARIHGESVDEAFTEASYNIDLQEQDEKEVRTAYGAFDKWFQDTGIKFLETEIPLVSEELHYGGTMDAVGEAGDKLVILDWKTSKKFYPDMLAQMAAYLHLWHECRGQKPDGCYLARFSKTSGRFHNKYFSSEDMAPAWKYFKHCRYAYKFDKLMNGLL